jgi:phenylalanyl-tRNA synthetase beta subunit
MPVDALNIAIVETGVALRAFDAESIQGQLCIRDSGPGECLDGSSGDLEKGALTIADDSQPIGLLFGPTAEGYRVERGSRRIAVAAVQVNGVPQIAVEEALWMAAATLEAA